MRIAELNVSDVVARFQDIVLLVSGDGRILDANQAAVDAYGYSFDEITKLNVADLRALDDQDAIRGQLSEAAGGGVHFEAMHRRSSGEVFPVDVNSTGVASDGGETVLLSIVVDLTEAKRAQAAIAAGREETTRLEMAVERKALEDVRLRLLSLASTDGLEPMLKSVLDEVCDATGSPIGFFHFVDEDQQSLTLQAWSTRTEEEFCQAKGKGAHYPIADAGVWVECLERRGPVIHNDYASLSDRKGLPEGHAPVVRELVVPVLRDDRAVAILGVGNKPAEYTPFDVETVSVLAEVAWDIAERRLATERIARSEERLQAVLDNSPYGAHMYELTDDDRLIFVGYNRRAEEILGIDHAVLLGLPLEEAFPGNAGTEVPERYRRAAREGTSWEADEYAYDSDDISNVFHVIAFPYGPNRATVFFRDITEQRKLEAALEESEIRYKTVFDGIDEAFVSFRVLPGDDGQPGDMAIEHANRAFWRYVALVKGTGGERTYEFASQLREIAPPAVFEARDRVLATGKPEDIEVKDTLGRWFHFSISRPEEGHLTLIAQDVDDRRRAEESLTRTTRALKALSRVNEAVVRAHSHFELFSAVCDSIVNDAGYAMAWVGFTLDDDEKSVVPVTFSGDSTGYVSGLNLSWADGPSGQGPTGRSIRERRPVVMRDIGTDPDFAPWREAATHAGFQSSMSLPLVGQDGVAFGALCIYSAQPDSFDDDEVGLLSEMAEDLTYGIEGLRSREQRTLVEGDLVVTNERLERVLREVTETMGKVVEARDPYTQGHQMGVAKLSRLIAEEMGLPRADVDAIEIAALVHDLGKLAVPTEILTKPGGLSATEFALIKQHSQAGYDILKDIDFGWSVADIALQHHERMDGSGYPNGLTGDEIVMAARVVAVADVVEAMASHRPYRAALGLETAVAEIKKHPEKFDGQAVAACVRLYEAGRINLQPG
jgi:PAS domain S-box-containing protein/putative nucleotidyltransferase with HDIG domain